MSFATIISYADAVEEQSHQDELSARFAASLSSHLIGFSALAPRPPLTAEGMIIERATEDQSESLRAQLAAREKRFRNTAGAHHKKLDWKSELGWPTDLLANQCASADLLVIGRPSLDVSSYTTPDIGSVVLKAGRPVLVVPPGASVLRARRIVIAWKNTREARRAVSDALPLLHDAVRVTAISIGDVDEEAEAEKQLQNLATFLAAHRITCTVEIALRNGDADANQLTQFAVNEDAGLIVTGAYGHSRLGEWMFGGMTRDLLMTCPLCCLMSS